MLLGLTLLCSHVLLSYGSVRERRQPITVFLLVSLGVLLGYWGWAILSISCSKVWENKRGFGRGFEDL